MNKTEELLRNIGLTETESKLYVAGLTTGPLTVQELSKKTGVKRPTAYHAIGTLSEKGLASERRKGSKSVFSMSPPGHLEGVLERQREILDERKKELTALLPILIQQSSRDTDKAQVVHYEGIEGVKLVLDIAFYCKSKKWDVIAPYDNFLRSYDSEYAKRYLNARKYFGIQSRTLWEESSKKGRPLTAEELEDRNPRIMPEVMHGTFKSMMILFDDSVAIFSSYEKLSAVLITSRGISALFQSMFDGLWVSSLPYKNS